MEERVPELLALSIVALVAVSMGLVMSRLRQSPIVGYILAGVLLGPTVIGFVPRAEAIPLMAQLGVLLLLFVIGMEISLRAFILDLRPAVLTVAGQLGVALALMGLFSLWLGWTTRQAVLLAFVMTMSSTAVALKMLEDIDELRSDLGRIVIAVMIAQDIAIVPILILSKALGSGAELDASILLALVVAVGGLILIVRALGRPGKINIPWSHLLEPRVELRTLAALAFCFVAATTTGILGLSPVYGAFIAGLFIGKTNLRSQTIHVMEPIQGVLMVLFFVAIGLLLDVDFIIANLGVVVAFVVGVLAIKSLTNILILRAVGLSWPDAFAAGLVMGQIGEFSFVLAGVGVANGLLDKDGYKLAIAVIVLSLLLSPVFMSLVRRVHSATVMGFVSLQKALSFAYSRELSELNRLQRALVRASRTLEQTVKASRFYGPTANAVKADGEKGDAAATEKPAALATESTEGSAAKGSSGKDRES